jgi:hypothetical protein
LEGVGGLPYQHTNSAPTWKDKRNVSEPQDNMLPGQYELSWVTLQLTIIQSVSQSDLASNPSVIPNQILAEVRQLQG